MTAIALKAAVTYFVNQSVTESVSVYQKRDLVDFIVDQHDNYGFTEFCDETASEALSDFYETAENDDDMEYYADQERWDDSGECYGNYQYARNAMGEPY